MTGMTIVERSTPVNHAAGRGGRAVEAVCLHVTDGDTAAGAVGWFRDPASGVSAHYVVDRDGTVYRVVAEEDTAWANGILDRPDLTNPLIAAWVRAGLNPNRATVSVEVVGRPGRWPWPAAQRAAVVGLVADICRRRGLPADGTHLIRHRDLDGVSRARCPGLSEAAWAALVADIGAGLAGAGTGAVVPAGADVRRGHDIGEGLTWALRAEGQVAASDEVYYRGGDGQVSLVLTASGRRYAWLSATGRVYRLEDV